MVDTGWEMETQQRPEPLVGGCGDRVVSFLGSDAPPGGLRWETGGG